MNSRASYTLVFLAGASVISTAVEGFSTPPLSTSNGCSSVNHRTSTVLRYIAEGNSHGGQYQRSFPNDVKIVDVEVEKHSEYVYIPKQEVEDAVSKAKENHEQDCEIMQDTIDKQREEINSFKERNKESESKDRFQYEHLTENPEVNWGENQEDKLKRTTDRVRFLTIENQRLQAELDEERERFDFEMERLHHQLDEARDETAEAQQILGLERSYFETATRLLELGLEREQSHVKALEDQLYDQQEYNNNNYDRPYFSDDLPPFETWDATGAYQQPDHQDQYQQEDFQDYEPQVRPQEQNYHYQSQGVRADSQDELFQRQESQNFYGQNNGQTTHQQQQQQLYASSSANAIGTRGRTTVTTTVMDADSIQANLDMNDIRDRLYR